ncbi:MAG TPA: glutaredoxin family protein [Gammaproteobacteria bacterium]
MRKLTLYSRPECHLCEALLADLMPMLAADDSVEVVDVDTSVAMMSRYGLRIPVLAAGEVELSGYPLDRERVRRYLESPK